MDVEKLQGFNWKIGHTHHHLSRGTNQGRSSTSNRIPRTFVGRVFSGAVSIVIRQVSYQSVGPHSLRSEKLISPS